MVTDAYPTGEPPSAPTTAAPAARRRGRRTMIVGTVIIVVSLIVGVTSAVVIGTSMGRPLYESFTNPSRATPVDAKLTLRQGRYTVLELTGHETTRGPVTSRNGTDAPPITAADVEVTGPDGARIPTSDFGSSSEEINRNGDVYSGVVRFTTPAAGEYRVKVNAPETAQVVIAPAFGSGVRAALVWLGTGFLSGLGFLLGVIVVIVGAVRRRRQPSPASVPSGGLPVKGWYPAPDVEGKQRYWDGQTWTEYLR